MPSIASSLSPNLSLKRTVRKPSVRSSGGIVVTQNRVASEIGARVLKEGGHAVDAAVAAAFAVGVVEPWMSGIGGVGAMLVREAKTGKITAVDFGGRSPKGLKIEDFPLAGGLDEGNLFGWPLVEDNRNTVGAKALVAPTEPAGIALAHKMFGTKPWRALVAPAVELADQGPVIDWHTMLVIASGLGDLQKDHGARAAFPARRPAAGAQRAPGRSRPAEAARARPGAHATRHRRGRCGSALRRSAGARDRRGRAGARRLSHTRRPCRGGAARGRAVAVLLP